MVLFYLTDCRISNCEICDDSKCFLCKKNFVKDTSGGCVGQ